MAQPGRDSVGTTGPGCAATAPWVRGDIALGVHTTRLGHAVTVLWARARQGQGAHMTRVCVRQSNLGHHTYSNLLGYCLFSKCFESVYVISHCQSLGSCRAYPMLFERSSCGILYKKHEHTRIECFLDANWAGRKIGDSPQDIEEIPSHGRVRSKVFSCGLVRSPNIEL